MESLILARGAEILLVYKSKNIELEKLAWLKAQIQEATEAEEAEE